MNYGGGESVFKHNVSFFDVTVRPGEKIIFIP